MTLLVPLTLRDLVMTRITVKPARQTVAVLAVIVFAGILLPDARLTLSYVLHPQYTFVSMADQIADYIHRDQQQHPAHSPLLLSISGSDISLITGVPSICDDFGTDDLVDRVDRYKPGWYAAWGFIEDDKMDALTPAFRVKRVATFPAMDDPNRNLMVLYRLEPADQPDDTIRGKPRRANHGRMGQQPSTSQLKH